MLVKQFFLLLGERIETVAAQQEKIQQAAGLCADALSQGRTIHVFDSGHLVSKELIHRAGGLVAMKALSLDQEVIQSATIPHDLPPAEDAAVSALVAHLVDTGQLRAGDVLFVGSVSGKTTNVVELAQQARQHGLTVIAVTALAYSSKLVSEHPSGKRLYESADLVLDNGAPFGDAMLAVEGLDYPICPASGIGAASMMWAVTAAIVEEMLSRGLKPTVYPSINRPDGRNLVDQVEAQARQKGY